MLRLRLVGLLAVLLAGCVAPKPAPRIAFPEAEYAALEREGTGVVRGQAFSKTRGGDVKYAAGVEILLNPVTSYSKQWFETAFERGQPLTEPDARYHDYIRKTIGDGEGRFEFSDVAPGEYYVAAVIIWEAPTGYRGALQPTGGVVAKQISVMEGEELNVVVSP